MGQQQLLLIVLGVIIVGVAVVVGIQMFTDSAETANVDQVSTELLQYAVAAQQFYAKPTAMGGGGKTFTDYTLSSDTTDNATYTFSAVAGSVVITGTCLTALQDNGDPAFVVITVLPKTVSTTVTD